MLNEIISGFPLHIYITNIFITVIVLPLMCVFDYYNYFNEIILVMFLKDFMYSFDILLIMHHFIAGFCIALMNKNRRDCTLLSIIELGTASYNIFLVMSHYNYLCEFYQTTYYIAMTLSNLYWIYFAIVDRRYKKSTSAFFNFLVLNLVVGRQYFCYISSC